nr:MAG TPA: hypothetical protein [Caudoviricetes sp.]
MNNTLHIKSLGTNDAKVKEMVKIVTNAKSKNFNHLTGLNEQQIKAVQEVLKRFEESRCIE